MINYATLFNTYHSTERPNLLTKEETGEVFDLVQFCARDIKYKCDAIGKRIIGSAINVNIDHQRGLYVYGDPGIGKSMAFKALTRLERAKFHPYPLWSINVRQFQEQYKINGAEYFMEVVHYPRVVIHNFGHHDPDFNDYGTKRNLVLDLLDQRYDIYQNNKKTRTYITSNFNRDYVKSLGPEMARRIREMMNYIEL